MPHLSDEDRIHTEDRGAAFAGECADLTDHTFHAALASTVKLITRALERDGIEPETAAEAAVTFFAAAVTERRRLFLVTVETVGSA